MSPSHPIDRRRFLNLTGKAALGGAALANLPRAATAGENKEQRPPNVILIMTDDQGYGDLGVHGNDKIRTPNLDRLAGQSIEFTQFYVCPVCAPTRACLMTGRYNYRTGAIDTYLGRAMMHPDEITIPEVLGPAGYRTGIFGKWHLGDNHPLRSIDQGFQESLVHMGGGIGQPSDPPGNSYFDPTLQHNGEWVKREGYCTDIFTDAAIRFIEENRDHPFFCYLPTNAPHTPLQIADEYVEPFLKMGLDETTAKVYGMIKNIDDNVGRLLKRLEELELEDDTIVIFLTDNGPQQERYTCGLRGRKGSVYEGGIRVPFFIRWPGRFEAGRKIDRIAGHIDVMPTLAAICGGKLPGGVKIDGRSLVPLLNDETPAADWPDRTLFFQWHRGDEPELYRACAARNLRWKLVNGKQLFDIENDPYERDDVADKHPDIVAKLAEAYEEWFRDVSSTRGYDPPRIFLGTEHENPVILTRQDWRGRRAGWGGKSLGHWEVRVMDPGPFEIRLRIRPPGADSTAHFKLGDTTAEKPVPKGADSITFDPMKLEEGDGRLEAWIATVDETVGVQYVDVKKVK